MSRGRRWRATEAVRLDHGLRRARAQNCTTGVEALRRQAGDLAAACRACDRRYLSRQSRQLPHEDGRRNARPDRAVGGPGTCRGWPIRPSSRRRSITSSRRRADPSPASGSCRTLQQELGLGLSPAADRPTWRAWPGYRRKTRTRKHHALVMPEIDAASVEQISAGVQSRAWDAPALSGRTVRTAALPCPWRGDAGRSRAARRDRHMVAAAVARRAASGARRRTLIDDTGGASQRAPAVTTPAAFSSETRSDRPSDARDRDDRAKP